MKKLLWAVSIFLITSSLVVAQRVEVKTIDGVQVVFNPKNPAPRKGTLTKLSLKEEFSLGRGEKEEDIFSEISSFAIDDEGSVYILDGKENAIKVFANNGRYLRTFGRKGQGPGEMNRPIAVHLTPAKELLVEDSMNQRFAFFSLDGKFLRNVSTAKFFNFGAAELDSQGNMIAQCVSIGGNKINREIKKFDRDLNPLFPIATYDLSNIMAGKINPFSLFIIYRVGKDDAILISNFDRYEIKVLNPDGKVIKRILKEYEPVRVTEEHMKEMLEELPPDTSSFKDRIELPKVLPPYRNFFLDDQGRIFVETFEKGKEKGEHRFDVFDARGNYIARIPLKGKEQAIKGDKLYSIEETEDGFQVLKCFSVRWGK